MRRAALALLACLAVLLGAASGAAAHPLGNFTINHLSEVSVSRDRVDVRYVLDQAEIPTFQERGLGAARVLAAKRREVERGLSLRVDGRAVRLRPAGAPRISFPPGQGGLKTTRVELALVARVHARERVELRDHTFAGRRGWRAIVVRPGEGTAVRSTVPSADPTRRLTSYPAGVDPLDQGTARLAVAAGDGTVVAPKASGGGTETTGRDSGDGFAAIFADAASGQGVLALLLLAAFGWGALHALSPGHGKAMVAAYLVGSRGTARHAVALGGIVTATHTAGVFALGFVTLALSQYVVPEDLYPWLTLVSGLLVVAVGAGVLRSRVRWGREQRAHSHDHAHGHTHTHDHDHDHHHDSDLSWRGLFAMGASAGLIPCPSALVVLLGAIAQHQVGLGLLLIVAFSLGLAATLTGLGIALLYARELTARLGFSGRVMSALPAVSSVLIIVVGCTLAVGALGHL